MNALSAIKVLIVGGFGKVGTYLTKSLKASTNPIFLVEAFPSRDSDRSFTIAVRRSDVVCLTISTLDQGEAARDYAIRALEEGKILVTCETGSLSYFYPLLISNIDRIGFSASCGIDNIANVLLTNGGNTIEEIHLIESPTLNFMPAEIFNENIPSCIMKACILLNVAISDFFTPSGFHIRKVSKEELGILSNSQRGVRFVISIDQPTPQQIAKPSADVFSRIISPWRIRGRFTPDIPTVFGQDVFNADTAIVVRHRGGKIQKIVRVGAGPIPIANLMQADIRRLLNC